MSATFAEWVAKVPEEQNAMTGTPSLNALAVDSVEIKQPRSSKGFTLNKIEVAGIEPDATRMRACRRRSRG